MSTGPIEPQPRPIPRWVKVSALVLVVLTIIFAVLHLTGHGLGTHAQ